MRRGIAAACSLPFVLMAMGCAEMRYSDSQNAGRQSEKARQAALASMKVSSSQAEAAQQVTGPALAQLLSGNTHVQAFRKRSEDPKPFLTRYDYYAPDGTYIGSDTHARRTTQYQEVGRWKVTEQVLCIARHSDEACYTIRLASSGAVQYWIYKPGDPFHGLLTRNIRDVRSGLQQPEYVSDPADFR
jgi:hypothetical protein